MNALDQPQAIGEFKAEKRTLTICLKAIAYGSKDLLPTKLESGEVIRFAKFPSLAVFIFKTEQGNWRVHDPKSGASLGTGGRTRKEAIRESFQLWERNLAKRGNLETLTAEIEKLRGAWNHGATANPDFI